VGIRSNAGWDSEGLVAPSLHREDGRSTVRRKVLALVAAGALGLSATAAAAMPSPPTNGGNGAGQSGQCTGPANERPASCQSSR
jgi:hypothetical protein